MADRRSGWPFIETRTLPAARKALAGAAAAAALSGCGHHAPGVASAVACLRHAHVQVERFDEAEPEGKLIKPHSLNVRFPGGVTAFVGFFATTEWAKTARRLAARHPRLVSPRRRGRTVLWYSAKPDQATRRTLEGCVF